MKRLRIDARCDTDSTMRHFAYALTVDDTEGDYVRFADATAALDRIKRQARAEGMRKAAEIANGCGREVDPQDGSYVCHHPLRGPLFRDAILAAAEQEEQEK